MEYKKCIKIIGQDNNLTNLEHLDDMLIDINDIIPEGSDHGGPFHIYKTQYLHLKQYFECGWCKLSNVLIPLVSFRKGQETITSQQFTTYEAYIGFNFDSCGEVDARYVLWLKLYESELWGYMYEFALNVI